MNLGWNCSREIGKKSLCYLTSCKNTFIFPSQNINITKNIAKPDTCITLINGTKYCYKDCSRIYFNAKILAETKGDTKYSGYMDNLYCNDHNYKAGDGCTNCSLDAGFHGSKIYTAYKDSNSQLI